MKAWVVAVLLISSCLAGCSSEDDKPEQSAPSSADESERTPEVKGEPIPSSLRGAFRRTGADEYFTFYAPGHDVCVDSVGTDQSCYAVRTEQDASATPVEMGVVTVDGEALTWVPTEDPGDCVGRTNRARWKATTDGALITPTEDCHGLEPLRLERLS